MIKVHFLLLILPSLIFADNKVLLKATFAKFINKHNTQLIKNNIEFWNNSDTQIYWNIELKKKLSLELSVLQAYPADDPATIRLQIADKKLDGQVIITESWTKYIHNNMGTITLEPGKYKVILKPLSKPGPAVMNFKSIRILTDDLSALTVIRSTEQEAAEDHSSENKNKKEEENENKKEETPPKDKKYRYI